MSYDGETLGSILVREGAELRARKGGRGRECRSRENPLFRILKVGRWEEGEEGEGGKGEEISSGGEGSKTSEENHARIAAFPGTDA